MKEKEDKEVLVKIGRKNADQHLAKKKKKASKTPSPAVRRQLPAAPCAAPPCSPNARVVVVDVAVVPKVGVVVAEGGVAVAKDAACPPVPDVPQGPRVPKAKGNDEQAFSKARPLMFQPNGSVSNETHETPKAKGEEVAKAKSEESEEVPQAGHRCRSIMVKQEEQANASQSNEANKTQGGVAPVVGVVESSDTAAAASSGCAGLARLVPSIPAGAIRARLQMAQKMRMMRKTCKAGGTARPPLHPPPPPPPIPKWLVPASPPPSPPAPPPSRTAQFRSLKSVRPLLRTARAKLPARASRVDHIEKDSHDCHDCPTGGSTEDLSLAPSRSFSLSLPRPRYRSLSEDEEHDHLIMIQESASAQKKKMVIKEVFFVNLLLLFVVNLFLRVKLLLQLVTGASNGHGIRSTPMIQESASAKTKRMRHLKK